MAKTAWKRKLLKTLDGGLKWVLSKAEYKSYLLSYDATVCMNGHVTRTFGRVVWTELFFEMLVWTRIV